MSEKSEKARLNSLAGNGSGKAYNEGGSCQLDVELEESAAGQKGFWRMATALC